MTRLSQGDDRWADDPYDNIFEDEAKSIPFTMRRKGCATTSLSLALQAVGVDVTPQELNDFMKEAEKAYTKTGDVHWWNAIDSFTKSKNNRKTFTDFRISDIDVLAAKICEGNVEDNVPIVVGVKLNAKGRPGHFVLAYGFEDGKILIHDPGFDRATLDDYGNRFQTRGFIKP